VPIAKADVGLAGLRASAVVAATVTTGQIIHGHGVNDDTFNRNDLQWLKTPILSHPVKVEEAVQILNGASMVQDE